MSRDLSFWKTKTEAKIENKKIETCAIAFITLELQALEDVKN